MSGLPLNTLLVGDALAQLRRLPSASVDCVITSPPYFQLRNYQAEGQIGLEPEVDQWVERLRSVMTELARVLVPTGAVWLVLADSYARRPSHGATPKSLLFGPERVALKLLVDGWVIRNKVVWAKPNFMPTPALDRLACSYEVAYLLVRSRSYFFDLDAIRQPHRTTAPQAARPAPTRPEPWAGPLAGINAGLRRARPAGQPGHPNGRNPGDVWTVAVRGVRGHHATFPEALVERPLLATCPAAVCLACGAPRYSRRPPCGCGAATRPGVVLDPFFGSGTVGVVAQRHSRDWLGIELNPTFAELARERLSRLDRAAA